MKRLALVTVVLVTSCVRATNPHTSAAPDSSSSAPVFVNGQPAGTTSRVDITTSGPSPVPTPGATPVDPSACCKDHRPSCHWDRGPSCDFLGPCTCLPGAPTPVPASTPTPIMTPSPTTTAIGGLTRIDGGWFTIVDPAHPERCFLPQTIVAGGDPGLYLDRMGHACSAIEWASATATNPSTAPNVIAQVTPLLRKYKAHGTEPNVVLEEMSTFAWCVGQVESPTIDWPTLGDGSPTVMQSLLGSGDVKPGHFGVVAYPFGWGNTMSSADLALLAKNNPAIWGHTWAPGAPDHYSPGHFLDDPTPEVITRDVWCADRWMTALRRQHPEVGHVWFEISTWGGSYGWQGRGYDVAPRLAQAQENRGYLPELQIEKGCMPDQNCGLRTWADCGGLNAAESYCDSHGKSRAVISIWDWNGLMQSDFRAAGLAVWQAYEQCPQSTCWASSPTPIPRPTPAPTITPQTTSTPASWAHCARGDAHWCWSAPACHINPEGCRCILC